MSATATPTKGKFLVAKEYPGSPAVGSEVEFELDAAGRYVSDGFLLEKSAKVENQAITQLGEAIEAMVSKRIVAGIEAANQHAKANGLGRFNVSVPEKAFAEAKEEQSLGEWLSLAGDAVSAFTPPGAIQKARDTLVNKYHTKFTDNTGQNWQQGAAQAENIFRSQMASKGLGQAEINDLVSKASAQSETIGALGGFTVPVQYSQEIIKLSDKYARLLPRCRKYTMTGLQMNIPAIDYSKGGNGASPYLGGMTASWLQDGQPIAQTNANVRDVILKANILSGYVVINRTLQADNQVGLQEVLTELMAETIAYYFDYAILNGTGVNQPLGVLNSAATIAHSRTSPGNGAILTDAANMFGSLHPEGFANAFWLVSPSAHATFLTMTSASGAVVYLPTFPNMNGGPATVQAPYLLFGMPVIVSQLPASVGTAGDMFLLDMTQMAVGLRQELELAVSEHVYFLSNQLVYRFLMRGDAQSRLNTYLTLQNGDTISPFVLRQ